MTDAELDEIEARAAACFVGPWSAETWEVECGGPDEPWEASHELDTVTAPEEYPRDPESPQVVAQVDEGGIHTPGLERFARPHAVFIAAARTDVPALVAEVRRLRAANLTPTTLLVEYESNNSGGRWPLDDEDWRALEAAGWKVAWVSRRKDLALSKDGKWLGTLATGASKRFPSEKMGIAEWEHLTGKDPDEPGCGCCGQPHFFSSRRPE